MFCENCGSEIPDNARFCSNCGKKTDKTTTSPNQKNMYFALFLSVFILGLGVWYAGDKKKGAVFFIVLVIVNFLTRFLFIWSIILFVIMMYVLYETYKEVKKSNGESADIIGDSKNFYKSNNFVWLIIFAVLSIAWLLFVHFIILLNAYK